MCERNIFHHEVSVHLQVATKHLCWHDLPHVSIDNLLPSISRAWDYKTKVELELLNDLTPHGHHLLDRKILHFFFREKCDLSTNCLALQHLLRKSALFLFI